MQNISSTLISLFLTPACFHLIQELEVQKFLEDGCHKYFISKCLGYGIILGSVLVKLPQILKILKEKSSEGLSFTANVLELCAITSGVAYGWARQFPFSAYGEGLFLAIQTSTVAFCVLAFRGALGQAMFFMLFYAFIMIYLLSPAVPLSVLTAFQAANVPIVTAGKLLQAYTNLRQGHTGHLSLVTIMLLFLGSLARIFTSVQETGDNLVILTYVVASVCNGIIVFQIFYYWNVRPYAATKPKSH